MSNTSNNLNNNDNKNETDPDTRSGGIRMIDTAAGTSTNTAAMNNNNNNNTNSNNSEEEAKTTNNNEAAEVIAATATAAEAARTSANTTTTTTVGSTTITGLPLDWTQMNAAAASGDDLPIRYPTDVSPELDVTDGELVLVGTAGQKITHMGPDFSKVLIQAGHEQGVESIHKVILRSHLIRDMQGLEGLNDLQLLELYDNQVQALVLTPNLSATLTVLDMSYNAIRDMSPVQSCLHLRELYLANNKLKTIAGLSGLKQLQKLDLGANRIRVMPSHELEGLEQIHEIWLGKNKIENVQGLSTLTKLRRLDLQSNRLLELPRDQFVSISSTLEELYLAHNGLTAIEAGGWLDPQDGVERLVFGELNVLDLSRNQLPSANALGSATSFPKLEELWLSGNQVADWSNVEDLKALETLETVYLEYNPIQGTDPLYRKSLAQLLPQLQQIDATLISAASSNQMLGTSGLVRGAANPVRVESEEDRMRRFQEMAIKRAKQEEEEARKERENDSDDSDTEDKEEPPTS